jgi:hypothetical protein
MDVNKITISIGSNTEESFYTNAPEDILGRCLNSISLNYVNNCVNDSIKSVNILKEVIKSLGYSVLDEMPEQKFRL